MSEWLYARHCWYGLQKIWLSWWGEDDANKNVTHAGYRRAGWIFRRGFQWWDDDWSYNSPDRLVPWHRLDWFAALDWFDAWRGELP